MTQNKSGLIRIRYLTVGHLMARPKKNGGFTSQVERKCGISRCKASFIYEH